jgi:hypothetical protein
MPLQLSPDEIEDRIARRERSAERAAKAVAARRVALDDPKRLEAITAYRIERERAEKQGKRVLRAIDDYRRTVPAYDVTPMRLLPGRR